MDSNGNDSKSLDSPRHTTPATQQPVVVLLSHNEPKSSNIFELNHQQRRSSDGTADATNSRDATGFNKHERKDLFESQKESIDRQWNSKSSVIIDDLESPQSWVCQASTRPSESVSQHGKSREDKAVIRSAAAVSEGEHFEFASVRLGYDLHQPSHETLDERRSPQPWADEASSITPSESVSQCKPKKRMPRTIPGRGVASAPGPPSSLSHGSVVKASMLHSECPSGQAKRRENPIVAVFKLVAGCCFMGRQHDS